MDIHDSEKYLGNMNNSSENIENKMDNSNENLEEINIDADNFESIHDELTNDNIVLKVEDNMDTSNGKSEEMNPYAGENVNVNKNLLLRQMYYKQLRQRQMINKHRNDIMRSVAKERYSQDKKNTVKQMIRMKKPESSYKSYKPSVKPSPAKCHLIPTSHSYGNFIRKEPSVDNKSLNIPLKIYEPTKHSINLQLRSDPIKADTIVRPWIPNDLDFDGYTFDRANIPPIAEKPKEINLAEIVTSILQDVLTGKISTIDNVIGKLRVNYEEKNMFANIKKRNIILLNFEDDTMRPVLKIDDKYIDIIKKWYEDCDLILDIEESHVSVPENITLQDVSGILFQDINYKYKDEYLENYMPLVINNLISKRSIKDLEKKIFIKPSKEISLLGSKTNLNIISNFKNIDNIDVEKTHERLKELGIEIPNNIAPSLLNEKNKSNTRNDANHFIINDSSNRIDPEILAHNLDAVTKYTLINPHEKTCSIDFEPEPYNSQKGFEIMQTDKEGNLHPGCYNNKYDCLNIKFGDNCVDDYDVVIDDVKKRKSESICVIINDKFLQTLTIKNPDQDIGYILKNHSEFGFVKLFNFSTFNNDIINFIEREFNNVNFNDVDEVNKKILVTSQYIDFANKQNDSNNLALSEENQVKKFLNSKYVVNDDINYKMKASTLYDIIINSRAIKIDNDKMAGFRTRLSKYLKDLGLQKKRYNDGFYYYGIVEKQPDFIDKEKSHFTWDSYDTFCKRREEEQKTYFNTNLNDQFYR